MKLKFNLVASVVIIGAGATVWAGAVQRDADGGGPQLPTECPAGVYSGVVNFTSKNPSRYTLTQENGVVIIIPIEGSELSDAEKKALDLATGKPGQTATVTVDANHNVSNVRTI